MANTFGIYIHIPFCKSKCDYCDFYSLAGQEEQMDRYQRALLTHLRSFGPRMKGWVADTVYFGGGTPSYYGEKRLREILSLIQRLFTVSRQAEITVECNPDSVDWRSMARLRRSGVNRISLGVQSADPQQLRCLHRIHSPKQVVQAVADIRQAKINNLSLDLIYGLPGQTMASWEDTLHKAMSLSPEHLSCYGLKVEADTPLAHQVSLGLSLPDGDAQADLYLRAVELLQQGGYRQYEISNFAKPGRESRHNLKYWTGREYLGFGPGAHSYFGGQRYAYPRDLEGYLQAIAAGSDTAILSIFGADPNVCYTGRSPLEAAATGIQLQPGDISYRCNMVTYEDSDLPFEEKRILSHSGGSIEGDQSIQLITDLFRDPAFQQAAQQAGMVVHPAASFRHIAVQSGASITGISLLPPHDHLGEVIGPLLPSGNDNAQVLKSLMKLAHQVLDHHPINEQRRAEGKRPANGVWFWAEGSAVALESFWEKYHKTGTVISAVPLCFGIARLSGLDIREVPGSTGELDTNYEGKVAAALEELRSGKDFVAVHVEAPDECTHNGDLPGKLQAIEWLDSRVVGPLTQALAEEGTDYRLLILSDHKTLTATRGHDADPVPYLLYDSRKDTGLGLPYCEESGQKGPAYPAGAPVLMKKLFAL